ncbi:MAG TPA: DUF4389 domain-containing protein [Amycolatopsis sp.]|jgi:hypothetical protein|nr:DUF4389 domain-containing protein [Amycolatopsis sp.]
MSYPVVVQASREPLSRWLWLVKWLLAIPHYFLLAFLWLAFVVLTIVAFFAILVTGRYPRGIFDFNVGVMRWSWRVHYYSYAALATDRYPPFSLADVPDYPARLEIEYPERLSRGLVLVKWWLLAIPQYIVVGVFVGGGSWYAGRSGDTSFNWAAGGLVGLLVVIAAIVLLFTGSYPKPIYDFVLGMDRWVIRVGAYAALMTDRYPPFRLDMGGQDPVGPVPPEPVGPAGPGAAQEWTGGRIASVIVGSVLALGSIGLITGGATALWADGSTRDQSGYVSASHAFATTGYALTSGQVQLSGTPTDWAPVSGFVGDVRLQATNLPSSVPVFMGIAPSDAVAGYLANVHYETVDNFGAGTVDAHAGAVQPVLPQAAGIWAAQVSGTGTQTLNWRVTGGNWTVVVMNADGTRALNVLVTPAATFPQLFWVGLGSLLGGIVVLAGGVALIAVPVYRASRPAR